MEQAAKLFKYFKPVSQCAQWPFSEVAFDLSNRLAPRHRRLPHHGNFLIAASWLGVEFWGTPQFRSFSRNHSWSYHSVLVGATARCMVF
jgi:hypothetical protein